MSHEPTDRVTPRAEPDWYHVEADDPDHSGFFESQADAETCRGDHGGTITALYAGPLCPDVEYVAKLERTLWQLMVALPVPKSNKVKAPYQDALILASQIEGRADFRICGEVDRG